MDRENVTPLFSIISVHFCIIRNRLKSKMVACRSRALTAQPMRPYLVDIAHAGGLPIFTGLDLALPSGTTLGLVGRSGGGKTTLTRLLLRMMDVNEGRILIGGQDISNLRALPPLGLE